MKIAFLIATLVAASILCACATMPVTKPLAGCWRQTLNQPDIAKNTITVCFTGSSVTRSIYYPNVDTPPTTCKQDGTWRQTRGGKQSASFREGDCENGRRIGASGMLCSVLSSESISCSVQEYGPFLFEQVPDGT